MTPPIAWITGGGTGIGRALAEALFRQGAKVALSGRREEVLSNATREIEALGGSGDIFSLAGDVSEAAYVKRMACAIAERWGDVDLLINNAGVNPGHSFQETPPDEFLSTFRINCLSAVLCTQAVLPPMRTKKVGSIVNVSSILGRWASPDSAPYSTSKYALAGLTDALRQSLVGTGVHVMSVFPGFILTPMTEPSLALNDRRQGLGYPPQAMAAAILKGLKCRQREVLFPWYVPWALRFHRWFPSSMEKLRRVFGR